jgi:hypothetical protein
MSNDSAQNEVTRQQKPTRRNLLAATIASIRARNMTRRTALSSFGFGGLGVLVGGRLGAAEPELGPSFPGIWTYRSFLSKPEIDTDFRDLEFARAAITIDDAPYGVLRGRIRWDGNEGLALKGTISYGSPLQPGSRAAAIRVGPEAGSTTTSASSPPSGPTESTSGPRSWVR